MQPVDPRDAEWEITDPSFRVYFWAPDPGAPGAPVGYRSREFEIKGADVPEVLAWAEETAAEGTTYTVYAVVEQRGERGLVRLAGIDPTAAPRSLS